MSNVKNDINNFVSNKHKKQVKITNYYFNLYNLQ